MPSKPLVQPTTSRESCACPAVFRASPALISRLRHSRRCLSTIFGCHVSTFLHPFAPPALPGFLATMGALTPAWRRDPAACSAPCGGRYLGILSPSCTTQVSLLHVFCPSRAFRLQPPRCPPWPLCHLTPQRHGIPALHRLGFALGMQARQSAWPNRVCFRYGRLCSPSVALHLASRRRSYGQLQAGVGLPEEDLHLTEQNGSQGAHPPAEPGALF